MFINNLNPVLLKLGIFEIRYYGIVYVIGFLIFYYFLYRNRDKLKITIEQVDNIFLYTFIGLIVGARLFHFIFSEPLIFITDPLELVKIWHGGMSFFGGLIGVVSVLLYYFRKNKMDYRVFGDIIVIPAVIALILGRLANFINGELVGTISSLPWCVITPVYDEFCRHPYQIYAAISHLILLISLLIVGKYSKKKGTVFYSFLIGYGILRFITDFFRFDPRYLGLTVWQYLSFVLVIVGVYLVWKNK
jgi:phosphatidylglycerol:prolipoprotein diacylglycerol transferase